MIPWFPLRYAVIVIGIGDAKREDLFQIAGGRGNRILSLRDLAEILPGKPAFKILTDLLLDPNYGKFFLWSSKTLS